MIVERDRLAAREEEQTDLAGGVAVEVVARPQARREVGREVEVEVGPAQRGEAGREGVVGEGGELEAEGHRRGLVGAGLLGRRGLGAGRPQRRASSRTNLLKLRERVATCLMSRARVRGSWWIEGW